MFTELRDDDHVVKHRIGRHPTLFQRQNEILEVLDGHRVQGLARKMFSETPQDCIVFAKGVGLLKSFDLIQVAIDQPFEQYRFRHVVSPRPRHDNTERERFTLEVLSALDFERLGDCRSRR